MKEFQYKASEHDVIDFLSAGPDENVMPYEDFQHCMNEAIEQYKSELFTYFDQQGLNSLRVQLVNYLQNLQVFTQPERIVITSGSQQALHLLISMPFPNGKNNILIEQPTYFGFLESISLQSAKALSIELTMEGVNLERLEYIFLNNDIKFFYIIHRFHNLLLPDHTQFTKPISGCYLSVILPEQITAKQVVHMLNEKNVFVDDATRMFLPEYKKEHFLRLSISQVEENQIKTGVERLAECIA